MAFLRHNFKRSQVLFSPYGKYGYATQSHGDHAGIVPTKHSVHD